MSQGLNIDLKLKKPNGNSFIFWLDGEPNDIADALLRQLVDAEHSGSEKALQMNEILQTVITKFNNITGVMVYHRAQISLKPFIEKYL